MLRYFYKKFGTTDLVPKLNLTGSRRRDFFISQIITEMVEKCNVPNQINIFLREQWTLNTRGSVVVTPPSFFLSGCLYRYGKKVWKTVRFPPSADPTKHGIFVLCVSGHFSVFEVLNFFVQQIIKNAPNQISGSLNESILKKNLKRLKKAFKIVLGNFEFLEIARHAIVYAFGIYCSLAGVSTPWPGAIKSRSGWKKKFYSNQKKSQGRSPYGVLCILDFFSDLKNLLISGTAFYFFACICSHASDFKNSFITTVPLSHKHRNQFSLFSDEYRSKSA